MRWSRCALGLLSLLLFACSGENSQPLPTLVLVPPTATGIPSLPPPSETPDTALTSPETLLTALAPTDVGADNSASAAADPIAAELILLARQQVADELGISARRVELVSVEPRQWSDSSLGCAQPEQTAIPVQVDGYRIVVRLNDALYEFHSDFDRVVRCETLTPTP